ncbi:NUDIX domain-containing protein [Candidatus Roizmanbacteria bacterium]|nr:NUDIX domain-containing protein [Candidatus Roizmanbacteria bacterium]
MKTRVIVAAIVEKDGKYLFGKKAKDVPPYPNTWHILGGGVEEGETLTQAIERELWEEGHIRVSDLEEINVAEDDELNKHGEMIHYIFHVFKTKYASGDVTPGDDIAELAWFSPSEFAAIPLNRPTVSLFKKIGWLP